MYNELVRQIRFAETIAEIVAIMEKAEQNLKGDQYLDVVVLCHEKSVELRFC